VFAIVVNDDNEKEAGSSTKAETREYMNKAKYKQKPILDWEGGDPSYVRKRLGPFTIFLDNERIKARESESRLQYTLIIAGALVPIVNVTGIPISISGILSSILGGIVVVCAGLLQFGKYHERWLSFKMITTKLSNEYYSWKNNAGEYAPKDANTNQQATEPKNKDALLVERCENIIMSEASDYASLFNHSIKPGTNGSSHSPTGGTGTTN
jgi:hypothetical protein